MIFRFLPKVHIHPILIIFIIISFLTGTFVELTIILFIVLIHELGHYVVATFFHWRVQSIMLWVFGGVMDSEEHGTKPIQEEILVTIAGPLQHVFIYLVWFILSNGEYLPIHVLDLILYYNTAILLFNLLPVWPLDGGKILLQCLSLILPYRKAYYSVIISSVVVCCLLLFLQLFYFPFTLSAFLIILFILAENRTEWKNRYYVFIRFLLNRYEGNSHIKQLHPLVFSHHVLLMDVFTYFRREKKHPIYITFPGNRRKTLDENDCLRSYFYEKRYNVTIGEIVNKLV